MTDLKKIAAEMRRYGELDSTPQFVDRKLAQWADALDALAAQEPVAWMDKWEKDYIIEASQFSPTADDAGHYIPLYAAPPPAAPVGVAELEKALDALTDAAMHAAKFYSGTKYIEAAHAEVLRLASAGVAPSVSREKSTCPVCGGHGVIRGGSPLHHLGTWSEKCPDCNGTGEKP